MFDEWAGTNGMQKRGSQDASGDVCFNGKPKEPCWYSMRLREADQRGFWMSFKDRGPQHRAVTTMTSRAKGGTTL